ncbi:MAG: chloramphenicol acetyltransferase [Bacteroidota bacterium]
MKTITFTDPHRQKHFEFFLHMDQPHFNICGNVEVGPFLEWVKQKGLVFTPTIAYALARTANEIAAFRYRIRGQEVVEYETVQPSFTVKTEISEVFSFCTVAYHPDFDIFYQSARAKMDRMKTNPSFEDEPGRDDYLFMSAFPWVSFTSFQHAMHYSPIDAVPRIAWGKYFRLGDSMLIPISVQAHHAVVDGVHMGQFFERLQTFFTFPDKLMKHR